MFGFIWDGISIGSMPFLIMSTALLPMVWPWWQARRALQQGATQSYVVHLWAALVVCGVVSWMLWPSLFGDSLQHGSTASFIFLVAPLYGAMALLIAYALAWVIGRVFPAERMWGPTPPWARRLVGLPLVLMCVLLVGMVMTCAQLLRLTLPDKATHPQTLRWLVNPLDLSASERAPQRMAYAIAGNPHAPADVLAKLSQHSASAVRLRVALHPHTDTLVLSRLRVDCAPAVRQAAEQRLPLSGRDGPHPGDDCD